MIEVISKFFYLEHVDVKNTKLKKYYINNNPKANNHHDGYLRTVPDEFQFFMLNGEFFIYLRFIGCILMPETNTITVDDILENRIYRRSWCIKKVEKDQSQVPTKNIINALSALYVDSKGELYNHYKLNDYKGFLVFENLNTGETIECYYYTESDGFGYVNVAFEGMKFPIDINVFEYKKTFIKTILEWMKI